MQVVPLADPGLPDLRSAPRFVVRVARLSRRTVLGDRVAAVEDGRLPELGSHDGLLALGGSCAALWRCEQSA